MAPHARRAARAALAASLVLAALLPARGALGASPVHPFFSEPVAEAVGRAVEFWGGTPCGGTVSVMFGPDSLAPRAGENAPGTPGGVAAMWAEWSTPAGANLFTEGPASFSDCLVHINLAIWPTTEAEDAGFADFCKEMLHEYGHFEGYPDVGARAGTIQYEQPDLAPVPLCERFTLRFGERVYIGRPGGWHAVRRTTRRRPRGRR